MSKAWKILLGAVALTLLLVVFTGPVIGPLVTAGFSLLAALIEFIRQIPERSPSAVEDDAKSLNNLDLGESKCRILICGMPRSGKTTTIRSLITHDHPRQETSTLDFSVYEGEVKFDLNSRGIPVQLADYRGQRPSQLIVDPPENFFGKKGRRRINAILFVVDLFPELPDDQEDPESYKMVMERYEQRAESLIAERVRLNRDYINGFSIEPILTVAYSADQLVAVRLLINKVNILEDFASKGYIGGLDPSRARDYALLQYDVLIRALHKACGPTGYNIPNFSVEVVNARSMDELRLIFSRILRDYTEKVRR